MWVKLPRNFLMKGATLIAMKNGHHGVALFLLLIIMSLNGSLNQNVIGNKTTVTVTVILRIIILEEKSIEFL